MQLNEESGPSQLAGLKGYSLFVVFKVSLC